MATVYPYKVGKDPTYDAWKAKADYQRQNAWYDAAAAQQKATGAYSDALKLLDQRGTVGRRNLDASLLSRGIFASGEAMRRRAELEAGLLDARSKAEETKAQTFGQISTDLQRAITNLDLEQETQVQAALARLRGGTRRTSPGGTPPPPSPPAAAPVPQYPIRIVPPVGRSVPQ